MKTQTRAVVIGGGIVGCSVLYHLTKKGWQDVVLVERDELTSGSTWHAAGGMHTINADPNVAKLQEYTINLYQEIEEISGQSCGVHRTGGCMLAGTPERYDFLKSVRSKARYLGLDLEFISMDEVKKLLPIIDTSHFTGALYDPLDGHGDPSGITQAYAKAARIQGAEVHRHTKVEELIRRPQGGWDVVTDKGVITTEHVINAGGLWAREVGRMVGLELPVLAMEHQYIITDHVEELEGMDREMGHCVDFEGEIYIRQERDGVLLGTYEKQGDPWSPKQTPWEFGHELLEPNLDRIIDSVEIGFQHFPALEKAGIKNIVNGPFTFAPDGNPLVGPVRGLPGFWCACGVMAGISQGGGVGLALSNWIIDGDPGWDIMGMDVARFGDYATMKFTNAKVRENYSRRFRLTYPNEELPAARPFRTSPVYDLLKARNAVFGVSYGLEVPLWFAPEGEEPFEEPTYRRSNAHGPVGEEVAAVRGGVGLAETTGFAKYEITGPDAETWLSGLLANKLPETGRLTLSPLLNPAGKLIGDMTVAKLSDERFMIFSSGLAEEYHLRWFEAHKNGAKAEMRSLRSEMAGLSIAGPKARELLARITDDDISAEAFKFLDVREMDLGMAPALVNRVTFTGDLGYEFWVRQDYQRYLFNLLTETGEDLGLRLFGGRAMNSMRLEKSFGSWMRDYRPSYTALEAAMDRFISFKKNDFIGRDAVAAERDAGPKRRLITLVVDVNPEDPVDPLGDEAVMMDNKCVGWVTSGGYCHHSALSVALAMVDAEAAGADEGFQVEILGDMRPARRARNRFLTPKPNGCGDRGDK
ncbi:MAG: GcvT family protein [Rhodospirillales bacterium]